MTKQDMAVSDFDYEKQAQDYYGKAPVLILGSGASSAHGMPGMPELANHIVSDSDTTELTDGEKELWGELCQILKNGTDIETALHQINLPEDLTLRIIKSTWTLIGREDQNIFRKILQYRTTFPLSRLLGHMFKTSNRYINIVTTNYDRLAEYACDQGRIHHYTGFTHGFFRQLENPVANPVKVTRSRRVNIWKVHGSLDWFKLPQEETIAISSIQEIPDGYEPQIVTPGAQKYQKTHLDPFRSIINEADNAINNAESYLCVGYGFNDEHIQPKLMAKCRQQNVPITLITYALSESAKKLIIDGKMQSYLAIERGKIDDQSTIYSSLQNGVPFSVEKNIWSLEGYLSLIM